MDLDWQPVWLTLRLASLTTVILISPSQSIVRLELLDGQTLLSRVTRRSAMALELHAGMALYAQVKSVALIA